MAKENLETKARKAILRIEDKVTDVRNVLYDVSSKLNHMIERGKEYYSQHDGGSYYK